jgi:hypothetical protein
MILVGLTLVFCVVPILAILVAIAWLMLGQKIFSCIFGG